MRFLAPFAICVIVLLSLTILLAAADPPPTMTNQSIVELVGWHFSTAEIISRIHSFPTQFDLSPAGIQYLADNHVTDQTILDAMFHASVKNARVGVGSSFSPAAPAATAPISNAAPLSPPATSPVDAQTANTPAPAQQSTTLSAAALAGNPPAGVAAPEHETADLTSGGAVPKGGMSGEAVMQGAAPAAPAAPPAFWGQVNADSQTAASPETDSQPKSPQIRSTRVCDGKDRLAIEPKTKKRPQVEGDYLVLFYNARTHLTDWYDYSPKNDAEKPVSSRNASFLPIVYTREKIAVHVCGLRFGDTLTVSTNPIGVPEGGADIRGVAPSAAPALTSTADALAGSGVNGGIVQPGDLGFGGPAPLGSLSVSGITAGQNAAISTSSNNSYTDATITISPQQLAMMMHAFRKNARAVDGKIKELQKVSGIQDSDQNPAIFLPGGIEYLLAESKTLLDGLKKIQNQPGNPDKQNPAAFDEYQAKVQASIGELGGLNSTLNGAALAARAIALQQNYATIMGVLGTVRDIVHADEQLGCDNPPTACPISNGSAQPAGCPGSNDNTPPAACPGGKGKTPPTGCSDAQRIPTGDTVNCHYWEKKTFRAFLHAYDYELNTVLQDTDDITPKNVFDELAALQRQLQLLDLQTGEIFKIMNRWYSNSSFEDTDLLTPITGNALERINIVVQRTYVPYTFAASSSSSGAAPPAGATPSLGGAGGGAGAGGTGASAGGTAGGAGASAQSGAGAGGGGGAGGTGGSTTTPAHTVKTVLVEVHRKANFNLVGGAMAIRVPTKSFGVQPEIATGKTSGSTTVYPASCNGGPTTNIPAAANAPSTPYYCATVTQTSNWQVAGMAGMAWFPAGRDYFPHGSGAAFRPQNLIPSALLATSVTSLGNVFLGPNFGLVLP